MRGLTVLVALLSSLALAATPEPLTWGADSQGGAPYVFQDPTDPNRLVGFEVELATLLGQRLGRQARPVQGQWDRLLELLARGVEHVCILDHGVVIESGTPEQVLKNPSHESTRTLLAAWLAHDAG